jgi:Tropinone reductase 1
MCRLAHPLLKEAEGGARIVNIGSVAGSVWVGSGAPYAMTKAALDQLTRYLAVEWAPDNIRVNAVAPWYTRTPLANAVLDRPEFAERVLARTPLGRIADPDDISGIVAFLCLPCARHITGQIVAVDGGFLALGL